MATHNETRTEDNYIRCDRYLGHESAGIEGHPQFTKFQDPETSLYYFSYLDDEDGSVIFRSEGYPTTAARDNGIDSVVRNMDLEERYKVIQMPDSQWYVSLRAGNHQEIARSCGYATEEEAQYLTPSGRARRKAEREAAKAAALAAAASVSTEADKTSVSEREEDNYLTCADYKGHTRDAEFPDFARFQHADGEYYFVMYDDKDEVVWRSEGYPTTAARDNGLNSVIKNKDLPERIKVKEMLGGYTYLSLRAGNHQEIARSCPKRPVAVETPAPVVEVAAAVAAPIIAAATNIEVPAPAAKVEVEKEDDYLPCDEYKGKLVTDKTNNVALFKHDNGQLYFVIYNADGSVRLRSEGFPNEERRNEELEAALKYLNDETKYNKIERAGHVLSILKDETGREVGRSCLEKIPAPVVETPKVEVATAAAAVATAAAFVPKAKVESVEDDYLPCDEYHNKTVNDKANNVALFRHNANGKYYFVIYKADGSVKLRSEGFEDHKTRDVELAKVLKYQNDQSKYTVVEKLGYKVHILKDEDGREVGRSCPEKIAVAAAVPPPPVVPPVVAPPVEAAAPIAEAAASTGFNWKWLLPLLLLLPLLWFMCNKCNTPEKVAVTPAPTPEVKKEEPKAVVPATKVSVKEFLPVKLYFDNDQPDANTTAKTTAKSYAQAYDAYYALRGEFASKGDGAATSAFFDSDVKKGMSDLTKLAAALKDILSKGESANIKIKGFASPLAKSDYNKALTGRRVSSVENYLKAYDTTLAKAITDGKLKISFEENGKDKAVGGVDNIKDKRGSIYGVDASKERRVEIVGIE